MRSLATWLLAVVLVGWQIFLPALMRVSARVDGRVEQRADVSVPACDQVASCACCGEDDQAACCCGTGDERPPGDRHEEFGDVVVAVSGSRCGCACTRGATTPTSGGGAAQVLGTGVSPAGRAARVVVARASRLVVLGRGPIGHSRTNDAAGRGLVCAGDAPAGGRRGGVAARVWACRWTT